MSVASSETDYEKNKEHYKAMFGSSLALQETDWDKSLDWASFKRQYYVEEGILRTQYDKLTEEMTKYSKIDWQFDDDENTSAFDSKDLPNSGKQEVWSDKSKILQEKFGTIKKASEKMDKLIESVYLGENSEKAFVHKNQQLRFKEAFKRKQTDIRKLETSFKHINNKRDLFLRKSEIVRNAKEENKIVFEMEKATERKLEDKMLMNLGLNKTDDLIKNAVEMKDNFNRQRYTLRGIQNRYNGIIGIFCSY